MIAGIESIARLRFMKLQTNSPRLLLLPPNLKVLEFHSPVVVLGSDVEHEKIREALARLTRLEKVIFEKGFAGSEESNMEKEFWRSLGPFAVELV